MAVNKKLKKTIDQLSTEKINKERKELLSKLVEVIKNEMQHQGELIHLNFICTHNSRRSVFAQSWFQALASHAGLENIRTYSGGTEATAVYEQVLKTLEKDGFEVDKLQSAKNPIYGINYSELDEPIIAFSKKYDDSFNPASHYIAVMVCDHAYENCPVVTGAKKVLGITYTDPKASDKLADKEQTYLACSHQIAVEMKWVIDQIKA